MTMMKRILRPAAALAAAAALATGAYAAELVPVGETVGIEVRTEGMLVAGLTGVETGSGEVCPAADSGIQPGDVIVRLGAHEISTSEDFSGAAETAAAAFVISDEPAPEQRLIYGIVQA